MRLTLLWVISPEIKVCLVICPLISLGDMSIYAYDIYIYIYMYIELCVYIYICVIVYNIFFLQGTM